MARFALRIWSAIISTFAVIAAQSPANSSVAPPSSDLGAITAERSKRPDLFLDKIPAATEQNMVVARGGGHSSHASHASHQSGSTGTSTSTPDDSVPSDGQISTKSIDKSTNLGTSSPGTNISPAVRLNNDKAGKSADTSSSASGVTIKEIRKIYLKDGGTLSCDYAWKDGGKVKVLAVGKVLTFDNTEIDLKATFGQ